MDKIDIEDYFDADKRLFMSEEDLKKAPTLEEMEKRMADAAAENIKEDKCAV